MANEAPRLTTADLRRRLQTPTNPADTAEPLPPTILPSPPKSPGTPRLVVPQTGGEPTPEDGIERPTGLVRMTPPDVARPAGRSSHYHPRPAAGGDPARRTSTYLPRPVVPAPDPRYSEASPLFDAAI